MAQPAALLSQLNMSAHLQNGAFRRRFLTDYWLSGINKLMLGSVHGWRGQP